MAPKKLGSKIKSFFKSFFLIMFIPIILFVLESVPLIFQDNKSILIITLNNNILDQENGEQKIVDLGYDLVGKLENELEKSYNINKEGYSIGGW